MAPGNCNKRLATLLERLAATLLLALIVAFANVGNCHAHANLVASNPPDNSILDDDPRNISLKFSEPVTAILLSLVEPDGTIRQLDLIEAIGNTLTVSIPDGRQRGSHVLNWRVVSADGHPVGGSLIYSIGTPTIGTSFESPATDADVRALIWLARLLIYGGCFLGVGGVFFSHWIETDHQDAKDDPVLLAFLLSGLIGVAIAIPLQGLDVLSLPLARFFTATAWSAGFATTFGTSAFFAGSDICLVLATYFFKGHARPLSAIALITVGLAFGSSGHAATAAPQWITRSAVVIHVASAAFWAGSLYPLARLFAMGSASAVSVLKRFSRTIMVALVPMLLAGLLLAGVQLQRFDALLLTDYGAVLAGKLVLVAVALALAAINRYVFTVPANNGDPVAGGRLVKTVRAEFLLIIGILAIAGLWRFTPPPRAIVPEAVTAAVHIHSEKAMADVTLSRNQSGIMRADISVTGGDFTALHEKEVTLVLSNPSLGIAALKRRAMKIDEGLWRVDKLHIPFTGDWLVRLDVLVTDFDLVKLESVIHIGALAGPS